MRKGAAGPPQGARPPGGEASEARSGGETPSPCTSVCTLDASRAYCIGCLRTIDEIAAWSTLDEDARRGIVASLPERRAALAPERPGGGAR